MSFLRDHLLCYEDQSLIDQGIQTNSVKYKNNITMEIVTIHSDINSTLIQGVGGFFLFNESWMKHKEMKLSSASITDKMKHNDHK